MPYYNNLLAWKLIKLINYTTTDLKGAYIKIENFLQSSEKATSLV